MDKAQLIAASASVALVSQSLLQWAEANLPDTRWPLVHSHLSKAASTTELILDSGTGSIHPDDGGTPKQ